MEAVASYVQENSENLKRISKWNEQFWTAIRGGDVEVVRQMAEADAGRSDPETTPLSPITSVLDAQDWDGNGPAMMATQADRVDILRLLLVERQMSANVTNYLDQTPLHVCRSVTSARLLLEHGCPLDAVEAMGNTALILAVQRRDDEIATLLIEFKADLDVQNHIGKTALHYADIHLAKLLAEKGADINRKDSEGLTPLIHHAHAGRVDIAILLVETGRADVNAADLGQRTCLHLSGFRGYRELVGALIRSGKADLERTTMRGNTPLHAASDAGHADIVEMLLQAGANALARNMQGKTPADLAKSDQVCNLLDDYSLFVRKDFKSGERVAAVMRAVVRGEDVVFTVKSGTFPEMSSITTVHRTLDDFVFLRDQLSVDHPEVFLPELRDLSPSLVSVKSIKSAAGSRVMKRIAKRLTHPSLSTHELFWEFLVVPDVEREMIVARTQAKRSSFLEDIYENSAPVVDGVEVLSEWFRRSGASLATLERAFKQVHLNARTSAKMKRDLGNHLRNVRYHIARPTSTIFDNRVIVSDLLKKISDGLLKQSLADNAETTEHFSEIVNHIASATVVLTQQQTIVQDYNDAVRNQQYLASTVERLETQAKTAQTEEKVRALSEAYYSFTEATRRMQQQGSLVTHTEGALKSEMAYFAEVRVLEKDVLPYEYLHQETERTLTEYAERQLEEESETLAAIEKTLEVLEEVGSEKARKQEGWGEGRAILPMFREAGIELQNTETPISAETVSFRLSEAIG
ncbi:hypothetical protein HDV00_006234 [Rhizophlyctis rosea]|nr:hypothetical protein HDV00_006234 [Rhizophlyctis rosea]